MLSMWQTFQPMREKQEQSWKRTGEKKKDELANELGLWNKDNDILKTFIIKVRNNVEFVMYETGTNF